MNFRSNGLHYITPSLFLISHIVPLFGILTNLPLTYQSLRKNQFFSLNCFVTNGTAIILPFHFTISHPFQPLNYPDSWLTYLLYKITNNLLYFPSDVFFLDPFVLMLLTFMSLNITLQAI